MWLDIVIVALFIFGGRAFAELAGSRTRMLARRIHRQAEDIYGRYTGSARKQRRLAKDQPSSPR